MKDFIRRVAVLELLIFVIIIIVQSNIIRAEEAYKINFQKINTKDGLSNRNITTIYQDSRGYMWIGTANGLNRYNGHDIKVYSSEMGNEKSLSSTYVTSIVEDSNGYMWIGTSNGLNILDVEKDEITRIPNKKNIDTGTIHFNITALYEDSKGRIWIGTEYGLSVYDGETGNLDEYTTDGEEGKTLTNNYITAIEEDETGNIWIGTKNGLNVLVEKNKKIESNLKKDYKYIYDIEKDTEGNIWVSTKEGIEEFDFDKYDTLYQRVADIKLKVIISDIMSDDNNNIWFATSEGLGKFNKDTGRKNEYKTSRYEERAISSNYVTCLFEDKDGVIWVGTDDGINVINLAQEFNLLSGEYLNSENLRNMSVTNIFQDSDNDYWIGTKYSGIKYIKNQEENVVSYYYDENKANSILSNNIKSIVELKKNKMLVATEKGLSVINKNTGEIKNFRIDEEYDLEVNVLHKDEDIIWIGTKNGLIAYYPDTGEVIGYKSNFNENGITNINIVDIYQDPNYKDILWLGGGYFGGLIKFNKKSGIEKTYIDYINNNLIGYGSINCIDGDESGNIWVGYSVGLVKFDSNTEKFYIYTEKDGLIDNYIYSLLLDDDDNVWVTTDKGISKLNTNTYKFSNYTEGTEIFSGGFNIRASQKREDGLMFLGGSKGLLFFNPKDILEQSYIDDNVVIENIIINNKESFSGQDNIELDYNENNIEISFFIPDYKNLNSIKYDYMLEGVDKDWIYGSSDNKAKYTLLSPGKYNFKVRAIDINGNVSDETTIKLVINRPYWKTPFAYAMYILVFLVVAVYIWDCVRILDELVKKRTAELNRQLEYNDKLYKEIIKKEKFKNAYFVNLSHELRAPLNVILSTVQLVKLLCKDKMISRDQASKYMKIVENNSHTLLKIINDIVDSSKIETGHYKINKANIDIVYIVEETALNMSKFIEEKGIEFTIDPDIEEKIVNCDATEIERCIINLLSNASKFTPEGGRINLYIKDKGNEVDIIVEDTGIGIAKEDQDFIFGRFSQVRDVEMVKCSSSGIGLTLVKYIVELHGGSIRLESEVDKGSKFIITLPVM